MILRIGSGFDTHRLEDGLPLMLGGIEIPFHKGSLGHSDGDVLIHSICDAILGALNKGDLGSHFPSSDPKIKGMKSVLMLKEIVEIMKENKAEISNLDSTIILEKPRISPHIESMKSILSPILGIDKNEISIKSKSADGIGIIGNQSAVAAFCTVLLKAI